MLTNTSFAEALTEAESRYAAARPRSQAAHMRAAHRLPGGNTRTVLHFPPFPLFAAASSGCRLRDLDGHEYVDFLCEYTAGLAGHDNPVLRDAISGALDRGWVNGALTEAEATLAEALCARFPSLERVRFCNSGTEANLMALTTARVFTGRPAIMAFGGGYHGGVLLFKDAPSAQNVPFETLMGSYNDADRTRDLLRANAERLAAVILEPMLGSGGCIPAEASFLTMLREECTRAGILLIYDEVMTSRLAPGGLQETTGVVPDLTTLGKYIGGGLSFGAFGGRADVLDRFDSRRPDALMHAGTFNNNPFTMSAGVAMVCEVYPPDRAVPFNAAGNQLRTRLQNAADLRALPVQVTGQGSMMCLHPSAVRIERPTDVPQDPDVAAARALIHLGLIERSQYTARRGMIVLSLPMGQPELEGLVAAVEDVLDSLAPLLSRLSRTTPTAGS
jgi:glutamate-1-semialdehyde 2,1-aminomutase